MNRRLTWLLLIVLTAGVTDFAVQSHLAAKRGGKRPLTRVSEICANLLVPRRPPRALPPGRPDAAKPVTYSHGTPTAAELRRLAQGTNVLICVLDAARVDHFGAYGYPRAATPSFDRLAEEAVVFDQHFCEETQTKPSTLSLLTGLYPDTHGLTENSLFEPERPPGLPAPETLQGLFARAGYATYLLTSTPLLSKAQGVGVGFQRSIRKDVSDPVTGVVQAVRKLLPEWKHPGRPFFAYVHILPPHTPYAAPAAFRFTGRPPTYWRGAPAFPETTDPPARYEPGSVKEWVNLYDGNLRWADSFLGELVRLLTEAGLLERTLLIITADHGESMREHDTAFHSLCPYDEALHIPLLLRFPGAARPVGRVGALTQTIDLFPTLLDLEGLPSPRVQGRSLVPLLTGQAPEVHATVVSRTAGARLCYVVRDRNEVLLLYRGGKLRAQYDLDRDPWQTRNIYQPTRAAVLQNAFVAFSKQQGLPPVGILDARPAPVRAPSRLTGTQRKQLHSLGYVD